MALRVLLAAGAAAALALPSAGYAQGYYGSPQYDTPNFASYDTCGEVQSNRRAAGAVVGGLIGGLLGNGVAAENARTEGTALGAVLGAAIGAGVSGSNVDCSYSTQSGTYGSQGGWSNAGYGNTSYGDPYGQSQNTYGYGQSSGYGHGQSQPYGGSDPYRPPAPRKHTRGGYDDAPAARQCETVYRITRLPDGREIHEPVEACREARFGNWDVDDPRY